MVYDFLIHYVLYVYQLCIGGLATGWGGAMVLHAG